MKSIAVLRHRQKLRQIKQTKGKFLGDHSKTKEVSTINVKEHDGTLPRLLSCVPACSCKLGHAAIVRNSTAIVIIN